MLRQLRGNAPVSTAATEGRSESLPPLANLQALSGQSPDQIYHDYRRMRDEFPVYKPPGQDFWCISRYADVQEITRQSDIYSSNIVGVMMQQQWGLLGGRPPAPGAGSQCNSGVYPVDVLAVQDLPAHKYQKKLTHQIVSQPFVKNLEPAVRLLATDLLVQARQQAREQGEVDFMQAVAWKLPMIMAMRLVGFPEADYPLVKDGCAHAVRLLSGAITTAELAAHGAEALKLYRYCWDRYEIARRDPQDDITGGLIRAATEPQHPLTDEEAVSIIFQLLIAGSDSSASTMGNALRLLLENPAIEAELRAAPDRIADYIEEVLRLESAFQGHFRLLTGDAELHGVHLKKGDRVFVLWASANRDERFWDRPEEIDINRPNLRKHVTFGYGLHACLGRELARMEIRVVLETLLADCSAIHLNGETPYVVSLFTRTLERLPVRLG